MSNYAEYLEPEEVDVIESEHREVPCNARGCRGGIVEVHGQETDCIECEGYGSVLI